MSGQVLWVIIEQVGLYALVAHFGFKKDVFYRDVNKNFAFD